MMPSSNRGLYYDNYSVVNMAIPFTDREIQQAWRMNQEASVVESRCNAHRLLLFYAVECGLKAVILKREGKNLTDHCPYLLEAGHNINRLLDYLRAGKSLKLPEQITMSSIRKNQERKLTTGEINQMWRYGGCGYNINDYQLEEQLIKISKWITQELAR